MPQKIATLDDADNIAYRFLLSAMSVNGFTDCEKIIKTRKEGDHFLDVSLIVNGIELPFIEVIKDWWAQVNQCVDEQVLEKVQNLNATLGLDAIADDIHRMRREMRLTFAEKLGKQIDWDD